jgi:hypothetical protein
MPRVPRSAAVHQSGPKKGKLKKGCRFVRGGSAVCSRESGLRGTYGCSPEVDRLVERVRAALTDELRKPKYRGKTPASAGHCYVASEALYHLLGGSEAGWKPISVRHEGEPHWYLQNERTGCRVDATEDQFCTAVPAGRGKGFLTKHPSKRAQILMARVRKS